MEKLDKNTIENYMTTIDLVKIPRIKMNYKQYLYKQRIKYGNYLRMGIVSENISFGLKEGKFLIKLDNSPDKDTEANLEDDLYKKLFYSSELDFGDMRSKREIRLRKMLQERIDKYKELIKKNNK